MYNRGINNNLNFMKNCAKCGMECEGFKCDECGEECAEHDANHSCGADHCMPKCKGCNEAEAKCAC